LVLVIGLVAVWVTVALAEAVAPLLVAEGVAEVEEACFPLGEVVVVDGADMTKERMVR
jgi:hypothetical protein